jgi:hypothetical protein|tara:strand:+ start:152 stop:313 length:162 start_codon:yes stop_codon:yes gene_type:complete
MKKRQIRMDDGSEFTVFFLKDKNIAKPATIKERLEKEQETALIKWFWGNKNYE